MSIFLSQRENAQREEKKEAEERENIPHARGSGTRDLRGKETLLLECGGGGGQVAEKLALQRVRPGGVQHGPGGGVLGWE